MHILELGTSGELRSSASAAHFLLDRTNPEPQSSRYEIVVRTAIRLQPAFLHIRRIQWCQCLAVEMWAN